MLLLLAVVGCDDPTVTGSVIDETSVTATVNETIHTIVSVSFSAPGVSEVAVEYGPDATYGHTTPSQAADGDEHSVTVIGIPAGSTWHFRVVATLDGETVTGEDHTVTAGEPDEDVRELSVVSADDSWDELVLAAVSSITAPGDAVVRDRDGELLWYYHVPDGQVFHARRSLDGRSILLNVDDQGSWETRRVIRVALDGSEVEDISTPWGHHDFELVPGVQFAYIAADFQEVGGETVVGDKIVEVLDDGSTRDVWSAFDQLEVREHVGWDYPYYDEGHDWTHANSLLYDEADDAYYLSLYWLEQVVKIDRATGETLWILGDEGDFALPGADSFGPQHGLGMVDGDLTLFDNGGEGSRLARYAIDEESWTAELVWSWSRDDTSVTTMGDLFPMEDGRTLSGWGETGTILALDADDQVVWEVDHEPPTVVGHVSVLDSLYAE